MSLTQIVHDAPIGVFLVGIGIVGAMTGICVYAGVRSWWQMRALGSVAAVAIAKARAGYVRVEGHAEPSDAGPLVAPLTHSPACWYKILVEDSQPSRSSSDNTGTWRHARSETSDRPFAVRDPSGRVLIDPYGADVTPTDRSVWYGPAPEPDDRNPPRFTPGQNPKGDVIQFEWSGAGQHRFRYTEERIYPNDPIFVQGEHRLGVVGEDDDDEGEDAAATTDAETGKTAADDDAPGTQQWCIAKPSQRRLPYLIATTSPQDMVNIHRYAIIATGIFAAIGVAAIVQLFRMRFG